MHLQVAAIPLCPPVRSFFMSLIHKFQPQVGPNNSFAGIALRYGISIAALGRANQLWPSDPIHFPTKLLILCGNALRIRYNPTHSPGTDAAIPFAVQQSPDLSPDLIASFFVAAQKNDPFHAPSTYISGLFNLKDQGERGPSIGWSSKGEHAQDVSR